MCRSRARATRLVVFGGTGFIGSHLVARLVESGARWPWCRARRRRHRRSIRRWWKSCAATSPSAPMSNSPWPAQACGESGHGVAGPIGTKSSARWWTAPSWSRNARPRPASSDWCMSDRSRVCFSAIRRKPSPAPPSRSGAAARNSSAGQGRGRPRALRVRPGQGPRSGDPAARTGGGLRHRGASMAAFGFSIRTARDRLNGGANPCPSCLWRMSPMPSSGADRPLHRRQGL